MSVWTGLLSRGGRVAVRRIIPRLEGPWLPAMSVSSPILMMGKGGRSVHLGSPWSTPVKEEADAFASPFPSSSERTSSSTTKVQPTPSRLEKTVNHVTLMGRVGGDPQLRGSTEHPVVIFSLATHNNYNYQSGEMLQKTDWHRVCVFKPYLRDSVYKYMSKGQRVYVNGRISYGEITDEQGKTITTTSIIADDVIFISDPRGNKAPATPTTAAE